MANISHTDKYGKAMMVDVTNKQVTLRTAKAKSKVLLGEKAYKAVKENNISKGDVLSVAKIAGIQAAKKTSELIPLCHNIFISQIDIIFNLNDIEHSIEIGAEVKTESQTGVEMEALTAASVAALTVYDMCKSVDKSIRITDIELISKTGGKSGDYRKK
ncbi:MAG: molybdenum cofactor biosynthesis protein C [Ignavibacteria bacterium GWB2_35_12]|nr:MAG: molybdenum cofactor biosynthesis protein C [Ignavibacteria bacterium GWA2_35_8]OGU40499.1 MAG: molybdenum cofactor biosynthesis protein C [Ignavibacteria bacterium GWB2_35_12]OGU94071.1 MAG: molybdenum cofactor biosynthesis protein C [Ignavibacteria bacterium RIFOXYA2_FULL_35_10]OGV23542.1 MAG: molybdenum cofactor biosynthesis protein C [Ignavibacteria bacterium RIFOXYC2_FULL_35_21]